MSKVRLEPVVSWFLPDALTTTLKWPSFKTNRSTLKKRGPTTNFGILSNKGERSLVNCIVQHTIGQCGVLVICQSQSVHMNRNWSWRKLKMLKNNGVSLGKDAYCGKNTSDSVCSMVIKLFSTMWISCILIRQSRSDAYKPQVLRQFLSPILVLKNW